MYQLLICINYISEHQQITSLYENRKRSIERGNLLSMDRYKRMIDKLEMQQELELIDDDTNAEDN